MANPKILIAGPFLGEFGWELMRWQGYIRYLSRGYDETMVIVPKNKFFLYEDFAVPFITKGISDCCNRSVNITYLVPNNNITRGQIEQEFIKYGKQEFLLSYDIVFHARNDIRKVTGDRNWSLENWNNLSACLQKNGYSTVSIGTIDDAFHVESSKDMRGKDLSVIANILASSKLCVGPSSGPMHFASLCKCDHLVLTDNSNWNLGAKIGTNKERYEKVWNPLKTSCVVLDDDNWSPSVNKVYDSIIHLINSNTNRKINMKTKNIKTNSGLKEKVLFWTPFNRAKFVEIHKDKSMPHPSLTKEWIEKRFMIWKKYCLHSILNQTCDDFIYVVGCDASTKDICDPLFNTINDNRVIINYRETKESIERIKEIGSRYDIIYSVRLDSDDMYHPKVAEEIIKFDCFNEWYFFKEGYCMDITAPDASIWNYNTGGTGPFFVHKYGLNNEFHKKKLITEPSHTEIIKFEPRLMNAGRFIVNITGMNTSTRFNRNRSKIEFIGEDKEKILREFNLI